MREVIYYIATSIDGYIAREDGSFDAFPYDDAYGEELIARFPETFPAPYRQQLGNSAENRVFDTVLMGRATYEVGVRQGITSPYPTLDQYVISRSMNESPSPDVTLVSDDVVGHVRSLRSQSGKSIWLCGGGKLASTLLSTGLLSRLIIKLNPVIFGSGIPLFGESMPPRNLHLTNRQDFSSGHLLLSYDVSDIEVSE